MNAPIKISATVGAWVTPGGGGVADVVDCLNDPARAQRLIGSLLVYSANKMEQCDWTRVGEAEITVTLMPRDEAVACAIKQLQARLEKDRAESHMRQQAFLDRISKLQALTYDEARTVEA